MTKTGGRGATVRHIAGAGALSVGRPTIPPPPGWQWVALTDVARLESGHTPSRKHAEYWGGDVPWLSIRDAKAHHAGTVYETIENTNDLGILNSSARLLPEGTVCLSRTASVGYVTIMGRPMATSQDFVNWVCSDKLDPHFLQYLLIYEKPSLAKFSSGAVHQTIYFPEVKAFHICMPSVAEQRRIVAVLDEAFAAIDTATGNAEKNIGNARSLFESYLNEAFGHLSSDMVPLEVLCDPKRVITYGVIKLGEHTNAGVPCLRTSNVRWLRIDTEGMKRITNELSQEYKRTILSGGEVLVNVRGTLGGVAVATPDMRGWNVSREVAVVPPDSTKVTAEYLAYWIGTHSSQSWLSGVEKGVAYSGINIADLRTLPVPLLPLSRQQEIVAKLNELSEVTRFAEDTYRRKVASLGFLKRSILQRAFAGELSEREVEAVAA